MLHVAQTLQIYLMERTRPRVRSITILHARARMLHPMNNQDLKSHPTLSTTRAHARARMLHPENYLRINHADIAFRRFQSIPAGALGHSGIARIVL